MEPWIRTHDVLLLALDAPLGWPAHPGRAGFGHQAGGSLNGTADRLFHRHTDEVVQACLRKRPLEVGANLIARTAHAALALLAELRARLGMPLPLAWPPAAFAAPSCIEVYPAAALAPRGIPPVPDSLPRLSSVIRNVKPLKRLSSHARDAVLCKVAALDFLNDECIRPSDLDLARKEGWIWIRRPSG